MVLLVVVDDFNIVGSVLLPGKTYAELVVDPYTVLPSPISPEPLQAIPGRHLQIIQMNRSFHLIQLPKGTRLNTSPAFALSLHEKIERGAVFEALNH